MTSPGEIPPECQQSDWCGPGSHCLCVPAARPAEPTGELREALRDEIHRLQNEPTPAPWGSGQIADALLSGPLAPLLAKLRAVEALVNELDSKSPQASAWHVATRIRAALAPQAEEAS